MKLVAVYCSLCTGSRARELGQIYTGEDDEVRVLLHLRFRGRSTPVDFEATDEWWHNEDTWADFPCQKHTGAGLGISKAEALNEVAMARANNKTRKMVASYWPSVR